MRVETANKCRQTSIVLPYTNDENITTLFTNSLANIKADYPEFGNSCWVNAYLEEAFATSVITSLSEAPFPVFNSADTQSDTLQKAIDAEWNTPRAHLCFWQNSEVPTTGATTKNPGNWVYVGKIALLKAYGYPERKHRWFDLLTDNIARKLGEGARIGVSFQWVDKLFYRVLNNVSYTPHPDESNPLILSRFSETLDPIPNYLSYRLDGLRTIDGSPLPVQPITSIAGNILTVAFTNELRVNPQTIKAIITAVGVPQKLTADDLVTIDVSWTQEIVSLQPDFVPSPVIVQGTVQTVTRQREQLVYTANATRQTVLTDRANRQSSKITNRSTANAVYYKLGSDVSTSPLIPAGQVGTTGGYHGIIAAGGSAFVDLPTGYTGTVSVVTSAGAAQLYVEEVWNVSSV